MVNNNNRIIIIIIECEKIKWKLKNNKGLKTWKYFLEVY